MQVSAGASEWPRLLGLFALTIYGWVTAAQADEKCSPNGPTVAAIEYCALFKTYAPPATAPNRWVSDQLGIEPGTAARSVALVIGIDQYPNMQGADVPPAAVDVLNLQNFLINNQKFDEVIVLQNKDASKKNILYFLTDYLRNISFLYQGRTRILITYSGHGYGKSGPPPSPTAPPKPEPDPALILSEAYSETVDHSNRFPLKELNTFLGELAKQNFQVLALINACYGGSIFGPANSGGNIFVTNESGAHALTAGNANELVWSLPGKGSGSIFFDYLIDGITTGKADAGNHVKIADASGRPYLVPVPVVRLGNLQGYLTETITDLGMNKQTKKPYGKPWLGSVAPLDRISSGAFFFLAPEARTISTAEAARIGYPTAKIVIADSGGQAVVPGTSFQVPAGAVSSVAGHPELKVFNQPDQYPIQGIDVSKYNQVDWEKLDKKKAQFAYIRATGIKGVDEKFAYNWSEAKRNKVARGAYHYYSYCQSPQEQFVKISSTVALDPKDMPVALDMEWPPILKAEIKCAGEQPLPKLQANITSLLKMLRDRYNRIPIVYGNRLVFEQIVPQPRSDYVVWLGDKQSKAVEVRLSGGEPWTIWQYSSKGDIAGVVGHVDQNVFFGTRKHFDAFLSGNSKIALDASKSKPATK